MHATKNVLPIEVRQKSIDLLQAVLIECIDLGLQAKQAHWNVRGPHFIALHQLFDDVAEALEETADKLAERIAQLGGIAVGTIQAVAAGTTLAPYPPDLTASTSHVEALSDALAAFGARARRAIDEAAGAGDPATADLFTEVVREIDQQLWFVEAHLG
jgi:starvation-inducible DNA-binding protein